MAFRPTVIGSKLSAWIASLSVVKERWLWSRQSAPAFRWSLAWLLLCRSRQTI